MRRKSKGGTLTLVEMEKLYKEAKKYKHDQCDFCKKKVRFLYFYDESGFLGKVCKDHIIEKKTK